MTHPYAESRGSWRISFRLARRNLVRRRATSLLIVATLAVPVFAATMLVQVWDAAYSSADRQASWTMGSADLQLRGSGLAAAATSLPAGSTTAPVVQGQTVVLYHGKYSLQDSVSADLASHLFVGMYVVRSGRYPVASGEIAVTSRLASGLGLQIGDSVTAGHPAERLTVVGIIDAAANLSAREVLGGPTSAVAVGGSRTLFVVLPPGRTWHPSDEQELSYTMRAAAEPTVAQQAGQAAGFTVVAGFAFAQFILLAAAAFAATVRQQSRDLRIIAATGGSAQQVARVIRASGILLGGIAGVIGVATSASAFVLGRRDLEQIVGHPLATRGLPIEFLIMIACISLMSGLLAAWWPSRKFEARPQPPSVAQRGWQAHRLLLAGLLLAAAGVLAAIYGARPASANPTIVALGAGLSLVGLVLCLPNVIASLGRLAQAVSLVPRLALRHAARHHIRTASAVAAVCATMAGTLGILLASGADTKTGIARQPIARTGQVLISENAGRSLTPNIRQHIAADLAATSVVQLHVASASLAFVSLGADPTQPPPDLSATVAVGDAQTTSAVTGVAPSSGVASALSSGEVIVFYREFISGGQVHMLTPDGRSLTVKATLVEADNDYRQLPAAVMLPTTARALGLTTMPAGMVISTAHQPTPEQLAAANDIFLRAQLSTLPSNTQPEQLSIIRAPGTSDKTDPLLYIVAAISALVTLVASTVAVSLALSEMRDDLSTLAAIGASRGVHRNLIGAQTFLIVAIGSIFGALAAFVPAAGLVALRPDLTWHVSWWLVAIVVILAPLAAVVGVMGLAPYKPTLVRRVL